MNLPLEDLGVLLQCPCLKRGKIHIEVTVSQSTIQINVAERKTTAVSLPCRCICILCRTSNRLGRSIERLLMQDFQKVLRVVDRVAFTLKRSKMSRAVAQELGTDTLAFLKAFVLFCFVFTVRAGHAHKKNLYTGTCDTIPIAPSGTVMWITEHGNTT